MGGVWSWIRHNAIPVIPVDGKVDVRLPGAVNEFLKEPRLNVNHKLSVEPGIVRILHLGLILVSMYICHIISHSGFSWLATSNPSFAYVVHFTTVCLAGVLSYAFLTKERQLVRLTLWLLFITITMCFIVLPSRLGNTVSIANILKFTLYWAWVLVTISALFLNGLILVAIVVDGETLCDEDKKIFRRIKYATIIGLMAIPMTMKFGCVLTMGPCDICNVFVPLHPNMDEYTHLALCLIVLWELSLSATKRMKNRIVPSAFPAAVFVVFMGVLPFVEWFNFSVPFLSSLLGHKVSIANILKFTLHWAWILVTFSALFLNGLILVAIVVDGETLCHEDKKYFRHIKYATIIGLMAIPMTMKFGCVSTLGPSDVCNIFFPLYPNIDKYMYLALCLVVVWELCVLCFVRKSRIVASALPMTVFVVFMGVLPFLDWCNIFYFFFLRKENDKSKECEIDNIINEFK